MLYIIRRWVYLFIMEQVLIKILICCSMMKFIVHKKFTYMILVIRHIAYIMIKYSQFKDIGG